MVMSTAFVNADDPGSLSVVESLARRIWPETYRDIISQEQINFMLRRMYSPEQLQKDVSSGVSYRLLIVDCIPCGFAAFGPIAPDTLKLHKLYLRPDMHHRGLGRYMMNQVIAHATRHGFAKICLNVNRNNSQSIRFYRACGYSVWEEKVLDCGGGFVMDDYIMGLELSGRQDQPA